MLLCRCHAFVTARDRGILTDWKRVCGYIWKFPQGAIRFCMGIPDHESIFGEQPNKYDWMETVYGCPTEEIPEDAP